MLRPDRRRVRSAGHVLGARARGIERARGRAPIWSPCEVALVGADQLGEPLVLARDVGLDTMSGPPRGDPCPRPDRRRDDGRAARAIALRRGPRGGGLGGLRARCPLRRGSGPPARRRAHQAGRGALGALSPRGAEARRRHARPVRRNRLRTRSLRRHRGVPCPDALARDRLGRARRGRGLRARCHRAARSRARGRRRERARGCRAGWQASGARRSAVCLRPRRLERAPADPWARGGRPPADRRRAFSSAPARHPGARARSRGPRSRTCAGSCRTRPPRRST